MVRGTKAVEHASEQLGALLGHLSFDLGEFRGEIRGWLRRLGVYRLRGGQRNDFDLDALGLGCGLRRGLDSASELRLAFAEEARKESKLWLRL